MRGIKRVLVLCLTAGILLTSGCADGTSVAGERKPDLAQASVEKKTTYRLHTVEYQQIGRELELSMNPGYYLVKSVRTDAEYQLKELRVARNQSVKAGEVIAVLQGQGSRMDAEQKRLEMNAYAAGAEETKSYYESLVKAAEALPAGTETEREMRSLRLSYAQAEYELFCLQSSRTLKAMEDAVLELEAAAGETYLVAPVDGSVRSLSAKYKEGDIVPAGTELCLVYAEDSQRLFGVSGSGSYVYGREVELTIGRGDNVRTYTGRIVSSPEVQPGVYASTDIYAAVDVELDDRLSDGKALVSYTVLENVLAVPTTAVTSFEGRGSVQILDGETLRTRGIEKGPTVSGMVTVLQGLQEGDQVVVSSYNS